MISYEMMVAQLEALGEDIFFDYDEVDHEFDVTIDDFAGFDKHWSEVMRPLDDAEAVQAFVAMLEEEAVSVEHDFYDYYQFDGFSVVLGYSSFDI